MVVRSITTLEYLNHANSDSFARLRRKRQILKLHFPNCNSNLKLKSLVNDLQIGDYRTGQKHVFFNCILSSGSATSGDYPLIDFYLHLFLD